MTRTISGGAAIAAALKRHDVPVVFGLPGAQIYPLFDGLLSAGIRTIVPRHEQTAGYMAMGFAKSSGGLGVLAVVPGPGVLNASAALCTALGNCSSVLCLTGQVPAAYLGKGRGHLHELRDQRATLAGILKDALRIDNGADAAAVVDAAIMTARSGRPGPVAAEMCWDTMAAEVPVAAVGLPAEPAEAEPDTDAVRAAAQLIRQARKPMIMCGAGAQHAAPEVRALAERIGAPVTAFRSGRGIVGEDTPLGINSVTARLLWDDTDLLIGIGSRLEMPYMRWGDMMRYEARPSRGPKLIRIDVDPTEMRRLVPEVAIVGDAARSCSMLVTELGRVGHRPALRAEETSRARGLAAGLIAQIRPHADFLAAIRRVLPREGFLVPELCQAGFASYTGAFPVVEPRTYVTEGFQGTLGFGFPTALGVKVANADKPVVSITGDGGFMFAVQELATAAQYGIGVVTILFNNESFGNVLRDQQKQYGGRINGAELRNPDFQRLAASFGVAACRADTPAALEQSLTQMLASGAPGLIEVRLSPATEVSPWPLIHMARRPVISDLQPR